eukprot:6204151-Pleurochrysis_carterae.AAC.1
MCEEAKDLCEEAKEMCEEAKEMCEDCVLTEAREGEVEVSHDYTKVAAAASPQGTTEAHLRRGQLAAWSYKQWARQNKNEDPKGRPATHNRTILDRLGISVVRDFTKAK